MRHLDTSETAHAIFLQLVAEGTAATHTHERNDEVIALPGSHDVATRLRVIRADTGPWVYVEHFITWTFCPSDAFNVALGTVVHGAYLLNERNIANDLVVVRIADDLCRDNGLAILTPLTPPLDHLPTPLLPFLDEYHGGRDAAADILLPVAATMAHLIREGTPNVRTDVM